MASSGAASAQKAQASAQKDIADMTTKVARELHDHWKTYYRDCDIAAIQEICATEKIEPDYNLEGSLAFNENSRNFARARALVYADDSAMCLSNVCMDCNYLSSIEASTFDDAANFAFRADEASAVLRNQAQIENLHAHLGMGKNLLSQAAGGAQLAAKLSESVAGMQSMAMQNWAKLGGYLISDRGQQQLSKTYNLFARAFGSSAKQPGDPSYEGAQRVTEGAGSDSSRGFAQTAQTSEQAPIYADEGE
jgi:hypothetical protein